MARPSPPHTQEFEDAIAVVPLSSHTYSVNLSPEWCVGSVPHGGYTMAVLHRLATTHFKRTHPARHNSDPMPIGMQMTFLRRTAAGPALLTVQDAKLGSRTSTIHVELSQEEDYSSSSAAAAAASTSEKKKSTKLVGYITVSDPASEVGISSHSDWTLYPPPPTSGPPDFITDHQDSGSDHPVPASPWVRLVREYSSFRRAANHTECYALVDSGRGPGRRGIIDQWSRFRPQGEKGGHGKWTDEAMAYLTDLFWLMLKEFVDEPVNKDGTPDSSSSSSSPSSTPRLAPFWFPTVALNIDFKKRLPPEGVEWLYSRVTVKSPRNGRTDIEVVVMDEKGEIVALATQIGLVVSASRNTNGRPPYKKKDAAGSGKMEAKI